MRVRGLLFQFSDEYREATALLDRLRVLTAQAMQTTTCPVEARERAYRRLRSEMRDWREADREKLLQLVKELSK
jgi:hypothetical protein